MGGSTVAFNQLINPGFNEGLSLVVPEDEW